MTETVRQMLVQAQTLQPETAPTLVEIPVCYGGKLGPDMQEVARHTGLTEVEIIGLHSQAEYVVAMVGFAPDFRIQRVCMSN